MSNSLGGFIFCTAADKYDYCFDQAIVSLSECCDKVSVVILGGAVDGSIERIFALARERKNIFIDYVSCGIWKRIKGKEKIAHMQNIAAMPLDTDYQLLVQADEVIHPDSYGAIREAMETGGEGFLCERVNLWGDPNHMLVVPLERQPCSVQVNRLTKRGYWCYDDGENIASPTTSAFLDKIKIIHYGFVRKKEVMKAKIINMQEGVFAMGHHDPKLDQCEVFDPTLWFSGDDLAPINFTHPPIMNQWVLERM